MDWPLGLWSDHFMSIYHTIHVHTIQSIDNNTVSGDLHTSTSMLIAYIAIGMRSFFEVGGGGGGWTWHSTPPPPSQCKIKWCGCEQSERVQNGRPIYYGNEQSEWSRRRKKKIIFKMHAIHTNYKQWFIIEYKNGITCMGEGPSSLKTAPPPPPVPMPMYIADHLFCILLYAI